MIICSCHGVTETQLRKACQQGGPESCRAGTGCGGCLATVSAIVEEIRRGDRTEGPQSTQQQASELRANDKS